MVMSALTSALSGAPNNAAGDASDPPTVDRMEGAVDSGGGAPSVSSAGVSFRPPAATHIVRSGVHASALMEPGMDCIVDQLPPASTVSAMTESVSLCPTKRHVSPWHAI